MPYKFNPFTANLDYYETGSAVGANSTADIFTTGGGSEVLTLSHTPVTILGADLGANPIFVTDDYTVSGAGVTLLNPNIPAGLKVRIAYTY